MTLISRIMGFARDIVIARIFGADANTDAFFVAFKIPNFLRRLFAEGAFSQAFVPVLAEYKEKKDPAALKLLIDHVAGTFATILFIITTIGVIAAPVLIMIFGPGFLDEPQKYQLAVDMLRWTFPYLFFIALTAFAAGIFNSFNQFAVPAVTPVLLNLSLISCAIWLAPLMEPPIIALAVGVFIAGAAQLLFQVPFLAKEGLLPRPRWGRQHPGVQKIMKLMLPAIFGSSVVQVNLLLNTLIASFLVTGSISWLYYSDRLVEFPLGVFGIALATVILPKLSKDHAQATGENFTRTLDWAVKMGWLIGVPATAGLMVLSGPMLATMFYGGEFGEHDLRMSQLSLIAYSGGLLGFILVKVLAPGFFARQDTKTPMKIGVLSVFANLGLNVVFVVPMYIYGISGAHAGLAAATVIAGYVNAFLLYRRLKKDKIYSAQAGWWLWMGRIVLATATMIALLWWAVPPLANWLEWSVWTRIWQLALWITLGGACYFLVLVATGLSPKKIMQI